jgi:hypothetical protein
MTDLPPGHYFSPAHSLIQTTLERFWIPIQTNFCCRRWRPAKIRGHSVSSALPCISFHNRAEGTAGTFQRGKFPNQLHPETHFSTAPLQVLCTHRHRNTHSTQQAWMYSRNQTTIASPCKHRQLVFLHPTETYEDRCPVGRNSTGWKAGRSCAGTAPLADSASSLYTTGFPIHLMFRRAS